ncbi:MAG: arginine repressor [Christensenellales bacterium]|jgi:transcriptional regulator of arginine metabolism
MKSVRHSMILEILELMDIETQEELAEQLKRHGVRVTQATVSRDIKDLRLVKVMTESGKYKYATSDTADKGLSDRFIRIFTESVLSIEDAGNLIVIKTLSASANAAAEAVDGMKWPEILGTLAGDNTIFVVVKNIEKVPEVMSRFRLMMRY